MHAWFAVLISFAFCLVTGWYVRNNRKTGYRSNNKLLHKALQIKGKMGGVEAIAIDERAKYKLALMAQMNKCIITVTFAGSLSLTWHPVVRGMFSVYKVLTLFVGDLLHLDCLNVFVYEEAFPFVFKEAIFWVLAFVGIVSLFTVLSLLFSCSKKGRRINTVATVLATIETLYPTICQKVFGLVACRWVGDRRFMLYDLDVECYADARHRHFVAAIAAPATVLFIFFIPLLQCVYTRAQRRNTHQNIIGRVFYRLMTVGLRPEHYLWRTMEKLETALIVFVLVFTSQYGPFLHAFAYVSIVIFTAGIEVYCDPYRTIRIKKELSETEQLGSQNNRAAFDKSDQTHENVFQLMKNRSVSVSLFNVFLGALSLGEDRHQQWRSKWWVSWETLQVMVAVTMILGNLIFMCWVSHLVYSQFSWYQEFQDCLCCRRVQKKRDRVMLKVTPELEKRQQNVGRSIVRRLSRGSDNHRDAELEKYQNADHHDQGKALLDEAHHIHKAPPTGIVPDEEKVIEAVISAGERFERSAARKSKLFAKLKIEAQKARERVNAQKKERQRGKLKKVDSIANDGLFSSTGHRKQSKKGRKSRPPGRGVAKSNLEELRRRKAERLELATKMEQLQKDGGPSTETEPKKTPELTVDARGSRMPGPNTGMTAGGAANALPVSELRNWKVDEKSVETVAEGGKAGNGVGAVSPTKGVTKKVKKRSSVMAKAEAAKAVAGPAKVEARSGKANPKAIKTEPEDSSRVNEVTDKGPESTKDGAGTKVVEKRKAGAPAKAKGEGAKGGKADGGERDRKTKTKVVAGKDNATKTKALTATNAKVEKSESAKSGTTAKEKKEKAKPAAEIADPKVPPGKEEDNAAKQKGKGTTGSVKDAEELKVRNNEKTAKAKAKKAKADVMAAKAEKKRRVDAKKAKKAKIASVKKGTSSAKM